MTSSPSTEREVHDTDILNTYRTTGRYSDRYQTLMQESPPRQSKSPIPFNSIVKDHQDQHEKVTDWQRRLSDRVDAAIEQIRPTEERKKEIPRYMQATRSHQVRVQTARADPLGVRAGGGIVKRVGTSKVPQFKSTTDINAIDDIKGEMAPDEVYIPMAARIKLFERGLGNGANKPAPTISSASTASTSSMNGNRHHHSNHSNHSNNKNHTNHHSISSSTSGSTKRNGHIPTQPIKRNNDQPRINKPAENAPTDRKSITKERSTELKPARKSASATEVKPFKFATSDRASHHEQVFKDRLKLWQVKDKEHQKNEKIRELKRKSSSLLNEKSKVRRTH